MNYYLNTIKIEEDGIIVEPVKQRTLEDKTIEYYNDHENAYKMPASSVIIAIGQGAETSIVKNKKIDTTNRGLIQASDKGATTREGVYAAGDVVSGARTVVEAVAATKKVAEEIDEYIKNKYKK